MGKKQNKKKQKQKPTNYNDETISLHKERNGLFTNLFLFNHSQLTPTAKYEDLMP